MGQQQLVVKIRNKQRSPGLGRAAGLLAAIALASGATFAASTPVREAALSPSRFSTLRVRVSDRAFGISGKVNVRVALPDSAVDYPLEVSGTLDSISWRWVPVGESGAGTSVRSLAHTLRAPTEPGFYRLALQASSDSSETVVDGPALAVMVPFEAKQGTMLNGYRIGRYIGERRADRERPSGFLEVGPDDIDLPVSAHLRIRDFLAHDGSTVWPRYIALEPALLDKLELVVAVIADQRGGLDHSQLHIDVHSGFRTPVHNRRISNAARDSRHQYGDAADVSIDADGNGRIDSRDLRIIERAVQEVERRYPDLKGGLGVYRLGAASYVHIDVRGQSVRWTS